MYRLALEEKLQVITIEDPVEIEEPFFCSYRSIRK